MILPISPRLMAIFLSHIEGRSHVSLPASDRALGGFLSLIKIFSSVTCFFNFQLFMTYTCFHWLLRVHYYFGSSFLSVFRGQRSQGVSQLSRNMVSSLSYFLIFGWVCFVFDSIFFWSLEVGRNAGNNVQKNNLLKLLPEVGKSISWAQHSCQLS